MTSIAPSVTSLQQLLNICEQELEWLDMSFNGIFGRVGRIASNEVIVQLVKSKCFPVLFYGLEVCSLSKYQYKSINYVINSTFRKIFNNRLQETVDVCLEMFGCLQAERTIAIRKRKFLNKFSIIHNALCRVFVATAKTELELCSQTFS